MRFRGHLVVLRHADSGDRPHDEVDLTAHERATISQLEAFFQPTAPGCRVRAGAQVVGTVCLAIAAAATLLRQYVAIHEAMSPSIWHWGSWPV